MTIGPTLSTLQQIYEWNSHLNITNNAYVVKIKFLYFLLLFLLAKINYYVLFHETLYENFDDFDV